MNNNEIDVRRQIEGMLYQVDDIELMNAWNDYCKHEHLDCSIDEMDEIENEFEDADVRTTLNKLSVDTFDINDNYYAYSDCDYYSFDTPLHFIENLGNYHEFLDWIISNKIDFGDERIRLLVNDSDNKLWHDYLSYISLDIARMWNNPNIDYSPFSFGVWRDNIKVLDSK